MPFIGPAAASFMAWLTSKKEVARLALKVRSTRETLIVGTRIAKPSSLPLSSGSTSPTAAAAPVLVGIWLIVALRARRRSLWKTSVSTWSLVYEWIVVIRPWTMPIFSCSTLASGARQFVVHDAL